MSKLRFLGYKDFELGDQMIFYRIEDDSMPSIPNNELIDMDPMIINYFGCKDHISHHIFAMLSYIVSLHRKKEWFTS